MKKLILTTVTFVFLSIFANAQTSKSDFRSFNWGASFNDVKKNEKAKFLSNVKDDLLIFDSQLAGSDCEIIYQFNDNDKFVGGTYNFTKRFANPQFYITDYNKFKTLLLQKYGTPKKETEEWSSNSSPTEKENWGQAVSDGLLDLNTLWETDRTVVKISLVTINNHPSLQIFYKVKSTDSLEDKNELQKALPEL